MRERVHTNKKSNNNSSTSVQNSFHTRPFITQRAQNPNGVPTQEDIVNQQYQQDRFEATKLEIQAKYGTITPEGQERLAVLQAKKAEFWQRYSGKTGLYGHDFSQIPLYSTDAPRQQTIQTKLTIGEPGDKYEQEADRVAAQVVNQINSPVAQQSNQTLQREEIPVIQKRPWLRLQAKNEGMAAPAELESFIQQARGGGQPLADNVRKPMEHAFGVDFSGVRVHTDAKSDELNQSIQAKAFTTGQDVFFRQGEYQPGSRGGQELLAHELTHVVQQGGGAVNEERRSETVNHGPGHLPESRYRVQRVSEETITNPANPDLGVENLVHIIANDPWSVEFAQGLDHINQQNHNVTAANHVQGKSTFGGIAEHELLIIITEVLQTRLAVFRNFVLEYTTSSNTYANRGFLTGNGQPATNVRVTLNVQQLPNDQSTWTDDMVGYITLTNAFPVP